MSRVGLQLGLALFCWISRFLNLLSGFCRIPFKTCESQNKIHHSPKKTVTFVVAYGYDKVVFFKNTQYIVQV